MWWMGRDMLVGWEGIRGKVWDVFISGRMGWGWWECLRGIFLLRGGWCWGMGVSFSLIWGRAGEMIVYKYKYCANNIIL